MRKRHIIETAGKAHCKASQPASQQEEQGLRNV